MIFTELLRHGRCVVFDTETTGLSDNDCILEIGAVEMIDGEITSVCVIFD